MRQVAIVCAVAVAAAFAALAWEDFGPLAQARLEHPEFFEAGRVSVCDIAGEPHYVFNGVAEILFDDEPAGRLALRAEVRAKGNLGRYLYGTNSVWRLEASGCRPLYRYREAGKFHLVLAVPTQNVCTAK